MKKFYLYLIAILIYLTVDSQTVWVTNSLDRMTQKSVTGSGKNIDLQAARGEWESFQVIIKAGSSAVTINDLKLSNFTMRNTKIPTSSVTLFREHFIKIDTPSVQFGGTVYTNPSLGKGKYADALIPFVDPESGAALNGAKYDAIPYTTDANEIAAFWVDIQVPYSQAAGVYSANYTLTTTAGNYSGTVSLKVHNFTLPVQPTLYSHFQTWLPYSLSERKVLLRNKLSPGYVDPSDDKTLVPLGLNCANLGFWSGANYTTCTMDSPPSVSEMTREVEAHDTSLLLYNYSADEISDCQDLYDDVQEWGRTIHAAGAKQLITMVPEPQVADDGTGSPAVDIFPILPKQLMKYHKNVKAAQLLGSHVWMYTALVQDAHSPKWLIDFSPVGFRNVGMLSARQGLKGILNWSVDFGIYEGDKVWDDGYVFHNSDGFAFIGEGNMLYPGKQAGIDELVQSMRLKWLRDAVEDYEYYHLLSVCGQETFAQEQMKTVARTWYQWSKNIDSILNVRNTLAAAIENCTSTQNKSSVFANYSIQSLSVFPNPANSFLYFKTNLSFKTLSITNNIGQEVYRATDMAGRKLNITSFPKGLYHLTLYNTEGRIVAREKWFKN